MKKPRWEFEHPIPPDEEVAPGLSRKGCFVITAWLIILTAAALYVRAIFLTVFDDQ